MSGLLASITTSTRDARLTIALASKLIAFIRNNSVRITIALIAVSILASGITIESHHTLVTQLSGVAHLTDTANFFVVHRTTTSKIAICFGTRTRLTAHVVRIAEISISTNLAIMATRKISTIL